MIFYYYFKIFELIVSIKPFSESGNQRLSRNFVSEKLLSINDFIKEILRPSITFPVHLSCCPEMIQVTYRYGQVPDILNKCHMVLVVRYFEV